MGRLRVHIFGLSQPTQPIVTEFLRHPHRHMGSKMLHILSIFREMLGVLLIFLWYTSNCNITFKIINRLKVNNDNLKFNSDFKSHIIFEKIS
jgi:hypothetical protein